ncbi:MAG: helix-turn-helix domain-containing protein [Pseudomonadales bacterium]|nr:helix-turn-helix domain-containing protein [Pseudomonadales bacterium]
MDKSARLLRIKEAAKLLGVSPATLRKWDNEGKLKAVVINERGDRRFKLSEINKFINQKE